MPAGQFVCKWYWAWPDVPPILQDLVAIAMANSSSNNFNFFFSPQKTLQGGIVTGVEERGKSRGRKCNPRGQTELGLWNWCEDFVLCSLITADEVHFAEAQVVREVVRQDLDMVA